MHMELSYARKSDCYIQCRRGMNKGIAVHYIIPVQVKNLS